MRLLGFSILYIFAVFKCCSEPIMLDGVFANINCKRGFADTPVSTLPGYADISSKWREDYIYPVNVCVTVKGEKGKSCNRTSESLIGLNGKVESGTVHLNIPINLDNFKDSDIHCHVFNATQFVRSLKSPIFFPVVNLFPETRLYLSQDPNVKATIQVSVRIAPYYFNTIGSIEAAKGDHLLHAVICNFPNCIITVEGKHKIKATEYFRKEKGKFPQPEDVAAPLTDKTFSVTSIECETGCPTKFIANDMTPKAPDVEEEKEEKEEKEVEGSAGAALTQTTTKSSNKSLNTFHPLIIGIVLIAAVFVLEA